MNGRQSDGSGAGLKSLITAMILGWAALSAVSTLAQNPEVQERLALIKESSVKNKQALAQYTWQEQDTISLKGEQKRQDLYKVRMGADGKPQKTLISPQPTAQSQETGGGRRGGRVKEKIIENKKEEYKEYAAKIGALAHSYAQPDPQLLQQAFQKGDIKPALGADPNTVSLIISNYLKPNDSMTLLFDKAAKAIQGVEISSYMDSPKDAVKIAVQFTKLPDGTNHVSTMKVDGVSKQLTVAVQNSNYQKP